MFACDSHPKSEGGDASGEVTQDASAASAPETSTATDATTSRPTSARDAAVPWATEAGSVGPTAADAGSIDEVANADVKTVPVDGSPAASNLPCSVRDVLARSCWQCHGAQQKYGAPMSLASWADLQRPTPSKPEVPTFERVLERVQDDARPMPPAPHARLTPAEQTTLREWVRAGAAVSDEACGAPPVVVEAPARVPPPADCESTYELRAHGKPTPDDQTKYTVAPHLDDTQYQCFYFDAPFTEDTSMFWYQPVLDNEKFIHHWILYTTSDKKHEAGTTSRCNSAEPGWNFVAGWGPGTDNVALPADVGLVLHRGPKAGFVLEVHYNNDTDEAQQDASGVRFCTGARGKRPHVAAVHGTGTEGICLEPGQKREVAGTCNPRTDLGDIHITGLWPHMHKRARHMKVTITRKSGDKEVLHDAPFDFNAQLYYVKDDVVLHAGDTLETRCFYENDTTQRTKFGEGTEDEMCYGFITAWPAGALTNLADPLSGLRSDLANRCADPLSVLASCNGIADAL